MLGRRGFLSLLGSLPFVRHLKVDPIKWEFAEAVKLKPEIEISTITGNITYFSQTTWPTNAAGAMGYFHPVCFCRCQCFHMGHEYDHSCDHGIHAGSTGFYRSDASGGIGSTGITVIS